MLLPDFDYAEASFQRRNVDEMVGELDPVVPVRSLLGIAGGLYFEVDQSQRPNGVLVSEANEIPEELALPV